MEEIKAEILVWSNNPQLEKILCGQEQHVGVNFRRYRENEKAKYILFAIDLESELSNVSQKIIQAYDMCRENKSKLTVTLLHSEILDSEKNIYFSSLLTDLASNKPLHRLVIVKDLYQTSLVSGVTWFDKYLLQTIVNRQIQITTKGEKEYYPLSVHDFINGLQKVFYLEGTAGKTFWFIGDPVSDLELGYLMKKKIENSNEGDFELDANVPYVAPGVHLASLGNQTAAVLNWEIQDDFYEAVVDIVKRISSSNIEYASDLDSSMVQKSKFAHYFYDFYLKVEKIKKRFLGKKIKISDKKVQYLYVTKIIDVTIFVIVACYVVSTLSYFTFATMSLRNSSYSISNLKDGNLDKSVKSLRMAEIYTTMGEYSFGIISPVLKILSSDLESKNSNVFTLQNYLNLSIKNTQQTYLLAEKIYKGLQHGQENIKIDDAVLALKSNLGQVYENLNQIELLAKPGQLPKIVEDKINESPLFKEIKTIETRVVDIIKAVDLLPSLVSSSGLKEIVIIFQNTEELHATGGRIDFVISISVDSGKIISKKIYKSEDIDALAVDLIQPPPVLGQVMGAGSWKLKDFNYNPDFSQTASNISWLLEKTLKINPSIILGINSNTIHDFENVLGNPNQSNNVNMEEKIAMILEKLSSGELSLMSIGNVVAKGVGENQVLYWTSDIDAESKISDQIYAGTILNFRCHSGLYNTPNCLSQTTYLNETSVGTKNDSTAYKRELSHKIKVDVSNVEHEYMITYSGSEGSAAPQASSIIIYQLFVTAPSEFKGLVIDGQLTAATGLTKQTDKNIDRYQIPVVLIGGVNRKVSILFNTPLGKLYELPLGYSITEYRQPGLVESGVNLEISHAEYLKPASITAPVTLGPNKLIFRFPLHTSNFGVSLIPK